MEIITQSEIALFLMCQKRHHYRYKELLSPVVLDKGDVSLVFGTAIHEGIAKMYQTRNRVEVTETQTEIKEPHTEEYKKTRDFYMALVPTYLDAYFLMYQEEIENHDYEVERIVEEPIPELDRFIQIKGMLDLVNLKKGKIVDHKTITSDFFSNYQPTDLQFMVYGWLLSLYNTRRSIQKYAKSITINKIYKVNLRQKQNENEQQFLQRCKLDIVQERSKYFRRDLFDFDDFIQCMHDFTMELQDIIDQMYYNNAEIYPTKNRNACFAYGRRCEFFDLCHYGNSAGLTVREHKHTEYHE